MEEKNLLRVLANLEKRISRVENKLYYKAAKNRPRKELSRGADMDHLAHVERLRKKLENFDYFRVKPES